MDRTCKTCRHRGKDISRWATCPVLSDNLFRLLMFNTTEEAQEKIDAEIRTRGDFTCEHWEAGK